MPIECTRNWSYSLGSKQMQFIGFTLHKVLQTLYISLLILAFLNMDFYCDTPLAEKIRSVVFCSFPYILLKKMDRKRSLFLLCGMRCMFYCAQSALWPKRIATCVNRVCTRSTFQLPGALFTPTCCVTARWSAITSWWTRSRQMWGRSTLLRCWGSPRSWRSSRWLKTPWWWLVKVIQRAEKNGLKKQMAGPTGHQLFANILTNHSFSLETLNMTKDDTLHLLSCL